MKWLEAPCFVLPVVRPCSSSCVPAVCQLLCLLQQPAQCWNVPIQTVYSHSVTCSSCSLGERSSQGWPVSVGWPTTRRGATSWFWFLIYLCVALCLILIGKWKQMSHFPFFEKWKSIEINSLSMRQIWGAHQWNGETRQTGTSRCFGQVNRNAFKENGFIFSKEGRKELTS